MRRFMWPVLALSVAACDLSTEPELRNQANQFELRAQWQASITGIGTSTISGTVQLQEYRGSTVDATASLGGALASRAYQWRIFRGTCSSTLVTADRYSTDQAYPHIVTNAAGTGTVARLMAGALDSTGTYHVRIRLAPATVVTWTNPVGGGALACGALQRS